MNYAQNIKYSFSDLPLPSRGEAVILLANNETYIDVPNFQSYIADEHGYDIPSYDELLMVASYYARSQNSNYKMLGLLYHAYYEDNWDATALITASELDFVTIHTDFGGLSISNVDMLDAFDDAFLVRDEPNVYPYFNYNESYSSYAYGRYLQTTSVGYKYTFDYSSLKNSFYGGEGYNELQNRDNQVAYNYTYLSLVGSPSQDGLYLDFGSPVHDLYEAGRSKGYGDGYSAGWVAGNENGFILGQNSGGLSQEPTTAMSFIGTAFNSVGNLLSIEILPNITLGLCFSIPLVFTLIITIFKLVRK